MVRSSEVFRALYAKLPAAKRKEWEAGWAKFLERMRDVAPALMEAEREAAREVEQLIGELPADHEGWMEIAAIIEADPDKLTLRELHQKIRTWVKREEVRARIKLRVTPPAPPADPITYLDANDVTILRYLSSIHPQVANTYGIEGGLDADNEPISRKTIAERLKAMPQYACQPKGERGGWGLTPEGIKILASL